MIPTVIYEDQDVLILNKPAGLLTHPRNENDLRDSLTGWLVANYPTLASVGDPERPAIVHRLDKETSGIIVAAKNQNAWDHLKKQFHDRHVEKTYYALVYDQPEPTKGVIDAPLFKFGTRQSLRPSTRKELTERAALTEYKTLKTYSKYSLLEIKPHTGRTHQIRIHLRSIGHPIVCDPIYAEKSRACPASLNRLFLHAGKISFSLPSGNALTIEAEMPPELSDFLEALAKNDALS